MTLIGRHLHCPATFVFIAVVPIAPALAGEPAAGSAPLTKDGSVIYARDVHHNIGAPHFPGESHASVTAPTGAIIGTIASGLAPLTDSETANVTASVPAALSSGGIADLRPFAAEPGASRMPAMLGAESGSLSIGRSIDRAMGTLTGALGSLSAVTGGRP
jgi:hypothetical protein